MHGLKNSMKTSVLGSSPGIGALIDEISNIKDLDRKEAKEAWLAVNPEDLIEFLFA
jgi:hypothetical protein